MKGDSVFSASRNSLVSYPRRHGSQSRQTPQSLVEIQGGEICLHIAVKGVIIGTYFENARSFDT